MNKPGILNISKYYRERFLRLRKDLVTLQEQEVRNRHSFGITETRENRTQP